jgi:hypothetical protein
MRQLLPVLPRGVYCGFPTDEFLCNTQFHKGGKEAFLVELERAVKRKAWEAVVAVAEKKEVGFSVRNAGVAGIIRRQERKRQDAKELTSQALGDLGALMDRAREAVRTKKKQRFCVTGSLAN